MKKFALLLSLAMVLTLKMPTTFAVNAVEISDNERSLGADDSISTSVDTITGNPSETAPISDVATSVTTVAITTSKPSETMCIDGGGDSESQDLYGFSVSTTELSMTEKETFKLNVTLDTTYYYENSIDFNCKGTAANVSSDGTITALSEGEATVYISAKLNEDVVELSETESTVRTICVKVTVKPIDALSGEKQAFSLSELKEKGDLLLGEFQRAEKILIGELPECASRITLDEITEFVDNSATYEEIAKRLNMAQEYPDFCGGSGVTNIEYWLNDNGSKKILLIPEQKDIIYVACSESGNIIDTQVLYSATNEISLADYEIVLIGSFKIYNGIDDTVANTTTTAPAVTNLETRVTTTTTAKVFPTERITFEEVDEIITQTNSFDVIYAKLQKLQNSPDLVDGSGLTLVEYWFDDEGSEKILVMIEQKQIYHVIGDTDGILIFEEGDHPTTTEVSATDIPTETSTTIVSTSGGITTSNEGTETTSSGDVTSKTESTNTSVSTTTSTETTLPQTGYAMWYQVLIIAAMGMMGFGGFTIMKSGVFRRKDDESE